jgi:hypothetical protein
MWSPIENSPGELGKVVFGAGVFVSIGKTRCATSPDGSTWTDCDHGVAGADQLGLHFVNGAFYIQFSTGQNITSKDGLTWSPPSSGWLPDQLAHARDGDRYVMARWGARGYSLMGLDSWVEVSFPVDQGLSDLTTGQVMYAGP